MTARPALRGVNLQVRKGEIFGFIGPNGAGKSTTIKILLGLLRPGSGSVLVHGKPPSKPATRALLGYLPEHPYFYDYLTGMEILRFFGELSGLDRPTLKSRIPWALEVVQANKDWIHNRLRSYSKGMLQRIGLAQAILSRPPLLILDEPMSGLDPMGRMDVRKAIVALNAEGITVFFSSHVLSDVEAICHGVAMVVDGRIVRQGTVDEVVGGESAEFLVRTGMSPSPSILPPGVSFLQENQFICDNNSSLNGFLQWCLEQGLGVEKVEQRRPSLEQVLAEEVSRV